MNNHRIIINADDLYMSSAIDIDIIEAAKKGQITSCSGFATVRSPANMEKTREAVCSFLGGMGLHLDLSFGHPLSAFFEKKENDSGWQLVSDQSPVVSYEAEFKAQVDELSKRSGGRITHIDVHRPDTYLDPIKYLAAVRTAAALDRPLRSPFGLAIENFIERISGGDETASKKLLKLVEIQRAAEVENKVLRPDAFVSVGIMGSQTPEIVLRILESASAKALVVEIGVHIYRLEEKTHLVETLKSIKSRGLSVEFVNYAMAFR